MPKIGSELLVSTDWQIAESKPIQQFTGRNKTEVEIRHLGAEANYRPSTHDRGGSGPVSSRQASNFGRRQRHDCRHGNS